MPHSTGCGGRVQRVLGGQALISAGRDRQRGGEKGKGDSGRFGILWVTHSGTATLGVDHSGLLPPRAVVAGASASPSPGPVAALALAHVG